MVQLGRGVCIETLSDKHRFSNWVPSRLANCVKKFVIEGAIGISEPLKPANGIISGIATHRFLAASVPHASAY
jgi:hypothetical protein